LVELLHARASVTSTTLGFSWSGPPAARACCAVLLTGNVLWSLVGTFMFISGLDHWKTPKAFAITSNITSDDPEYADSTGEESTGEQVLRLYFLVVVFLLPGFVRWRLWQVLARPLRDSSGGGMWAAQEHRQASARAKLLRFVLPLCLAMLVLFFMQGIVMEAPVPAGRAKGDGGPPMVGLLLVATFIVNFVFIPLVAMVTLQWLTLDFFQLQLRLVLRAAGGGLPRSRSADAGGAAGKGAAGKGAAGKGAAAPELLDQFIGISTELRAASELWQPLVLALLAVVALALLALFGSAKALADRGGDDLASSVDQSVEQFQQTGAVQNFYVAMLLAMLFGIAKLNAAIDTVRPQGVLARPRSPS
jgi:hypothetical protein